MTQASRRGRTAPALLWVPGLLAVSATLLPVWYLWVRSTENGWGRWREELTGAAGDLLLNSVVLAAIVGMATVAVALPAAWLTTRTDVPGRRAWAILLALPLAIPSYVIAMATVSALGPRGLVQGWLEPLGVERLPEIYGLGGASFVLTISSVPYVYLVLRAALRSVDPAEEEASRSLGAGAWATFLRVTLPALVPAIAAAALLVVLYVLSDFGGVALVRYNTFTRAIFVRYGSSFDRTGAAILGVILAVVSLLVLIGEGYLRQRYQKRMAARKLAPARAVPLGAWRWPALAFLALIAAASLVLPIGVLLYWLARGLDAGARFPDVTTPAWNSLSIAGAGAAITVLFALPVAVLAARFGGRGPRAVEQLAFLTHALPGLVVALSLVFFGIRYTPALYQTLWMLVFAYVVLFLPNALAALRSPLLRQSMRLEEAGASLGRGTLSVLLTVTLPIARPGAIAALALVFLAALKELPATLLLSPPGYRTLPGIIWQNTNEGLYAAAAFPALVLIAVAAVPIAVLIWRGDEDAAAG